MSLDTITFVKGALFSCGDGHAAAHAGVDEHERGPGFRALLRRSERPQLLGARILLIQRSDTDIEGGPREPIAPRPREVTATDDPAAAVAADDGAAAAACCGACRGGERVDCCCLARIAGYLLPREALRAISLRRRAQTCRSFGACDCSPVISAECRSV